MPDLSPVLVAITTKTGEESLVRPSQPGVPALKPGRAVELVGFWDWRV
jgi:hypothetical protein